MNKLTLLGWSYDHHNSLLTVKFGDRATLPNRPIDWRWELRIELVKDIFKAKRIKVRSI